MFRENTDGEIWGDVVKREREREGEGEDKQERKGGGE